MFVNCIVCFVTGKGLFDDVSPFRSLAKLYLAWCRDILHYFHKFIFVLRGLLFDKFSRHSIIEIISTIPMKKRWDRFYISSIFRETVKIHFHEISNFLTLLKPYVIYKIINSTKYIPRTISQSNFLHLETFTDTRCSKWKYISFPKHRVPSHRPAVG